MAALTARKALLLAKSEVSYGVDPTPDGTDAILTSNLAINAIEADLVDRNLDRPTLGNDIQLHVGIHVSCSFNVEIAGAGAAGDPPGYGDLLKACGMSETVNAGTDVQYDPDSGSSESVTMKLYFDGQEHVILGARGTFSMAINTGAIPQFTFNFTGLYVAPSSQPDPTPDFSEFVVPIPASAANTPTFSLFGQASNLEAMTINYNGEVVYRDVVNSESVIIVDRAPGGTVNFEMEPLSDFNWFTTATANTLGAMQIVHGITAGNIITVDAAQTQLLNPRYGESDGVRMMEVDLSLTPTDTGDDDLKITVA